MTLTTELRYAGRRLRLNPGYAAVTIITLAIGIGATTAMFSVVDGVLLKSLRYPDVERIVAINTHWTDSGRTSPRTTGGDLEDLRRAGDTFAAFSYYQGGEMGVQLHGRAEFIGAYTVDPEFFHVFAMTPTAGRTFSENDAGRAAVVSTGFAQRNFGSSSAALGQALQIEGVTYEIVGVMPPVFQFPSQGQVWAAVSPVPRNRNRSGYNYYSVAKLKPGISPVAANARLLSLAQGLGAAFPDSNRNKTFLVAPLQEQLAAPVRTTLLLLMGAVGLVLLIACANVANLMLARATVRSRELAVRAALGAARGRLVLQLFCESLVLAGAAALLGICLAAWGTRALLGVGGRFVPTPLLSDISYDWRVLAFTLAASLVTTLLFGITPALQATRVDLQDALRRGTRGTLGIGSSRTRNFLVVVQIALSLMLAVGAGLLGRTLLNLHDAALGFRTEGILVAHAHAPARTLPEALAAGQFFDDLRVKLRQLPGVISTGGAMGLPAGYYGSNGSYAIEGKQTFGGDFRKLPYADFSLASPGYFSTMEIPLLRGRDFNEGDIYDRPFVVIISQTLARQNFPNEDPIGHRIMCGLDATQKWMTIVGIVGDVRQDSPASQPAPDLYMPLRQHPFMANEQQLVTRTNRAPELLIPAVQNAISAMNPEVAARFNTMNELVSDSIRAQRFRTALASSFAVLAVLLALSGMYAVMSYSTSRRTSEFGLRSALGALPRNILLLVLRSAGKLAAAGAVAGLLLSAFAARLLSAMLFGIKPTDVTTYLGVIAAVLPVIVLAAAIPAWQASRVDPSIALRSE